MDFRGFKSPVVFIANTIGDHVVALPTVRMLQNLFHNLRAILLPGADVLFYGDINFEKKIFVSIPKEANWLMGKSDNETMERIDFALLREEIGYCDLFLSLNTWHSPNVDNLLNQLNPKMSVGFFSQYSLQLQSQSGNMFDILFQQGKLFDSTVKIEDYSLPPLLGNKEKKLKQSLIDAKNESKIKFLVLHTDTKNKKMWGATSFQEFIDVFLGIHKNYVVCIIGGRHNMKIDEIRYRCRVVDFCGLPLSLSFGLIECADFFLGVDSCMLHVADLCKIPSLGLFGPTDSNKWGLRFAKHVHIQKPLNELSVEEVLNKLFVLMGE